MIRRVSSLAAVIILSFVSGEVGLAQTAIATSGLVRLQIVVSRNGAGGTRNGQRYTFSVTTNEAGKFSAGVDTPAPVSSLPCTLPVSPRAGTLVEGVRVEGTVSPAADGRFNFDLVI